MIKKGIKVKIKFPNPLPGWIVFFLSSQQIQNLDNTIIDCQTDSFDPPSWWIDVYTMPLNLRFVAWKPNSLSITCYLCVDWLQEISSNNCDCPLSMIMARGCRNKNHQ